jgi:hypothetical protein
MRGEAQPGKFMGAVLEKLILFAFPIIIATVLN